MAADTGQIAPWTWNKEQWGAVWLWLYERVVPLVIEDDRGQGIQGCGYFISSGSATYFITAAHVFDNVDPADVGIPLGPYSTHFTRLGTGSIRTTRKTATTDIDVAIFPVPPEVLATLEWRQISVENMVAIGPEASASEYLFFGYPTIASFTRAIGFRRIPCSCAPAATEATRHTGILRRQRDASAILLTRSQKYQRSPDR